MALARTSLDLSHFIPPPYKYQWNLPHYFTTHCIICLQTFPSIISLALVFVGFAIMRSVGKILIGFILLAALLGNGGFVVTEARPLNVMGSATIAGDFFEGLSLGAIKQSGPSPGGDGHKFVNFDTFGGIKDSGPTPGDGHSHVTSSHH